MNEKDVVKLAMKGVERILAVDPYTYIPAHAYPSNQICKVRLVDCEDAHDLDDVLWRLRINVGKKRAYGVWVSEKIIPRKSVKGKYRDAVLKALVEGTIRNVDPRTWLEAIVIQNVRHPERTWVAEIKRDSTGAKSLGPWEFQKG